MSKNNIDISTEVMSKIKTGQLKMKPKWMFVVGTVALVLGVVGAYILSVFLVSLISFSLRSHGPMGAFRYQELLASFPVWAVGLAVVGLVLGIGLLRKFEFSYKKNFWFIILTFIVAVLISGWLVDYLGIDTLWSKQGQMKKLYQRYDGRGKVLPWRNSEKNYSLERGIGQGRGHGYNEF